MFPVGINKATQFKPGQSGNPAGKPKSLFKKLKAESYTKDDYYFVINALLGKSYEELLDIVEVGKKDPNTPSIVLAVGMSLIKDIKTGSMSTTDSVLDRLFGRPKQSVDHAGSVTLDYDLSELSVDHLKGLLKDVRGTLGSLRESSTADDSQEKPS